MDHPKANRIVLQEIRQVSPCRRGILVYNLVVDNLPEGVSHWVSLLSAPIYNKSGHQPRTITASEYARLVEQEWKAAGPMVANVTALYLQGRFSRTPLTPGELSRAAEQVGRLQSLTHVAR